MKPTLMIAALCIGAAFSMPSSAATTATAPRNFDCSKPGNANKTACKPAAAKAPATKTVATVAAAPKTLSYDCTKAGNANKTACKATVARPAPQIAKAPVAVTRAVARPRPAAAPASKGAQTVAFTEKNGKVVHFDCSKTGNATKQACK